MKSNRVGHGLKWAVCSALLSATTFAAAAGPRETSAASLTRLESFALPEVIESTSGASPRSTLHPSLEGAAGRLDVFVRLAGQSVAGSEEAVTREQVLMEQAAFINRILAVAPSAEVVASMQLATNAVVLRVDAADLPQLARDTAVTRVVQVSDYRQDLSETVPYIGADTAHSFGARGQGVRIAVIDSGVDYTHAALGGPGTQASYEAAWAPLPPPGAPAIPTVPAGTGYLVVDDPGTAADNGLFPSKKVIGGYDFVGERWPTFIPPGSPPGTQPQLEPDPDPIGAPDATTFGGHGTHVADIIAGKLGVAPGAKVYALKACSAPATSCSGVALIQSMEFALDPNGDGRIRDRVDIINMSLGSTYGQPFDDDLSLAVDNATRVGVLTVASAGNSADKQFTTGSPAAASSALSVAQTEVPSAALQLMELLAPITGSRGAVFQPWSAPLTATIEGPVFYPAAGGKRLGCADANGTTPYTPGELAGRIVLVDRGSCSFSLKIANIAAAGGVLGIIGLVTPDAPFAGAFGGGVQTIPGYMISQADANVLRTGTASVRFSPENNVSLAGTVTSTSARGPRFDDNIVKPEIGAPGASVSADSGGFTATSAFGGTSGSSPMVAGAAAILKEARPFLRPLDIKQLLINTAETQVFSPSVGGSVLPDQLAPITRIGGGEVRVDRALFSPVIVSDVTGDAVSRIRGAMSFGYLDASKPTTTFTRRLEVENRSFLPLVYSVSPTLRYQDDKDTGAVTMTVSPSKIVVYPFGSTKVTVKLTVDGTKLRNNLMNSGNLGNAIGPLTANEYDGYVVFKGHRHQVTMPWHILPRKSADVVATLTAGKLPPVDPLIGVGFVPLENKGVGDANIFAYSALGSGPDTPRGERGEQQPNPTIRVAAVNTFLTPAGAVCSASPNFVWEFAFNMYERKASPVGTIHEVDLDVNNDGTNDFAVISQDVGGITSVADGRQVTAVINLATGASIARFFVEHATNSSNVILRVCGNDLGLTQASIGQPMRATFVAFNWYFGGEVESLLGPFALTPFGEEYTAAVPGDLLTYKQKGDLAFTQWPLFDGTDPHAGVLLVNNSDFGPASRGGATARTEGLFLPK
jgi:minor extracellular serine protease Vpr